LQAWKTLSKQAGIAIGAGSGSQVATMLQELHRLADNHAHDWVHRHRAYIRYFGADLSDADGDNGLLQQSRMVIFILPLWTRCG
jgi:hypothetical protein